MREQFEAWAKALRGSNGGDPSAEMWLLGLEYGGEEHLSGPNGQKAEIKGWDVHNCKPDLDSLYTEPEKLIKWRFHGKASKCYLAFNRESLSKSKWEDKRKNLFSTGSETFMLNLFPLHAKNSESWTKEHIEITGRDERKLYEEFCMTNRFPEIYTMIRDHKPQQPQLVLCLGLMHQKKYEAVLNLKEAPAIYKISNNPKGKHFRVLYYPSNGAFPKVGIIPHLSCALSDAFINEVFTKLGYAR